MRENYNIRIVCLNLRSVQKHFLDVKGDHQNTDLILLTETWLPLGQQWGNGIDEYSANLQHWAGKRNC